MKYTKTELKRIEKYGSINGKPADSKFETRFYNYITQFIDPSRIKFHSLEVLYYEEVKRLGGIKRKFSDVNIKDVKIPKAYEIDFIIDDKIIIETKGTFNSKYTQQDRLKVEAILESNKNIKDNFLIIFQDDLDKVLYYTKKQKTQLTYRDWLNKKEICGSDFKNFKHLLLEKLNDTSIKNLPEQHKHFYFK